jgi:hypothetical protein
MKVLSTKSGETERIFKAAFVASGLMAAIFEDRNQQLRPT